jgi:hypothetical protein
MRRLSPALALLVGLVLAIALAGVSTAAPSKYRTFGTGEVSFGGGTATLANDSGEYSGIYLRGKPLSARRLSGVHISFRSTGDTAGGAPRFSIPLNTGHTESVTPFAFLDVNNCGGPVVSTDDPDCKVFLNFSSESFDNWDDLVATHPSWRVTRRGIPFIIADQPGTYRVSNIDLH